MTVSKTKRSLYNLAASIAGTLISATLGIYVAWLILNHYGSDYNGLHFTITQTVALLTLVEVGFTISINLALYKPVVENDTKKINAIFAATQKIFQKVGLLFFILGFAASVLIPLFINTQITYWEVAVLFAMAVLPAGARIFFVMKYTCLFNVHQQEYIVQIINIATQIFLGVSAIIIVNIGWEYLVLRGTHAVIALLTCVAIWLTFKLKHPHIRNEGELDRSSIKGTQHVAVQKICGTLYASFPMIMVSIFIDTKTASIYGVYLLVIAMIKSLLNAAVRAPTDAFGQVVAQDRKEHLYQLFFKHNVVNIMLTSIFLATTMSLYIPFISLYTANIAYADYINRYIALLLVITAFIELSHIPSGIFMNVNGNFKQGMYFQLAGSAVILVFGTTGIFVFGLYGLLGAILICALVLAFCEIFYVYRNNFNKKLRFFALLVTINILPLVGLSIMWHFMNLTINSIPRFILWGGIIFVTNAVIITAINFAIFNKYIKDLFFQILGVFKRKRKPTDSSANNENSDTGEIASNDDLSA